MVTITIRTITISQTSILVIINELKGSLMRCITAKQSTAVSGGGGIGEFMVTGALIMGLTPVMMRFQNLGEYAVLGVICGALLSIQQMDKDRSAVATVGSIMLGAYTGLGVGMLQGELVEAYHRHYYATISANQTAV